MRKILIVIMLCLISAASFANFYFLNKRNCTAILTRKYFNSNGVNIRTKVIINTASTCVLAMQQAKTMAGRELVTFDPNDEVLNEGDYFVDEESE